MAQVVPVPVYDAECEAAIQFAAALGAVGVSAQEAADALRRVSELLAMTYSHDSDIHTLQDTQKTINAVTKSHLASLERQVDDLQDQINQLRPVSNAETETPNQKSDLENFSPIRPNCIEPIKNQAVEYTIPSIYDKPIRLCFEGDVETWQDDTAATIQRLLDSVKLV